MLNADDLPFPELDSMIIEMNSQQLWRIFRVKFEMGQSVGPDGQIIYNVSVTQTELVNGKAFSAAELVECGQNVFEEVIAKGFVIRFNPIVHIEIKKVLPKFLLLEDPYNSLSGRTFIFRAHFPRFIYEINHENEAGMAIDIEGIRYVISIHENIDEQPSFEAPHLKEAVTWYHYSRG